MLNNKLFLLITMVVTPCLCSMDLDAVLAAQVQELKRDHQLKARIAVRAQEFLEDEIVITEPEEYAIRIDRYLDGVDQAIRENCIANIAELRRNYSFAALFDLIPPTTHMHMLILAPLLLDSSVKDEYVERIIRRRFRLAAPDRPIDYAAHCAAVKQMLTSIEI